MCSLGPWVCHLSQTCCTALPCTALHCPALSLCALHSIFHLSFPEYCCYCYYWKGSSFITSGQCKSMCCLTTALKHRFASRIWLISFWSHFFTLRNLITDQNVFQISPPWAILLKQSDTHSPPFSISIPLHPPGPLTWKSQHQVFIWMNFIQPLGGMCSKQKAFDPVWTCDKHDSSSLKALSLLLFHSVLPRRRLSRRMTSWCSDTYAESGTEWVYRAGREGAVIYTAPPQGSIPGLSSSSWVRALFADEGTYKEVTTGSICMFTLEKEEISASVYPYTHCMGGRPFS